MTALERRIALIEQRVMPAMCILWKPDTDDAEELDRYLRQKAEALTRGDRVIEVGWIGA